MAAASSTKLSKFTTASSLFEHLQQTGVVRENESDQDDSPDDQVAFDGTTYTLEELSSQNEPEHESEDPDENSHLHMESDNEAETNKVHSDNEVDKDYCPSENGSQSSELDSLSQCSDSEIATLNNMLPEKPNDHAELVAPSLAEVESERAHKQKDNGHNHPLLLPCKCKKTCIKKINEERRNEIHRQYWEMKYDFRRTWMFERIDCQKVKRRRPKKTGSASRAAKHCTNVYSLKGNNNEKHIVCKHFFLSTLGYKSDKVVTVLMKSCPKGIMTPPSDKRGRHPPKHKMSAETLDILTKNIESFKPTVSHYRREHAPLRRYISSEITRIAMYNDFKSQNPNIKCSYESYRECISKMNISFTKLGEEECEDCVYKEKHAHDDESLCTVCADWEVHIKNAKEARAAYVMDAEKDWPSNTLVMATDMQKVMMLPRMPGNKTAIFTRRVVVFHQTFAELGKSWKTVNQTDGNSVSAIDAAQENPPESTLDGPSETDVQDSIQESTAPDETVEINELDPITVPTTQDRQLEKESSKKKKKKVHKRAVLGVVWHEGISGRNAEDLVSAYVAAFKHYRHHDNFVIWADNCSAQNKNWTLFTAMAMVVNQKDGPNEVVIKYLEKGHTFMAADSFHASVERLLRRSRQVHDIHDFVKVIKDATTTSEALLLPHTEFRYWENGMSSAKFTAGKPLLNDVTEVKFVKGSAQMSFKTSHEPSAEFKSCHFLKLKVSKRIMEGGNLPPSRDSPRGAASSKVQEIIDKLTRFMNAKCRKFWNDYPRSEGVADLAENL